MLKVFFWYSSGNFNPFKVSHPAGCENSDVLVLRHVYFQCVIWLWHLFGNTLWNKFKQPVPCIIDDGLRPVRGKTVFGNMVLQSVCKHTWLHWSVVIVFSLRSMICEHGISDQIVIAQSTFQAAFFSGFNITLPHPTSYKPSLRNRVLY